MKLLGGIHMEEQDAVALRKIILDNVRDGLNLMISDLEVGLQMEKKTLVPSPFKSSVLAIKEMLQQGKLYDPKEAETNSIIIEGFYQERETKDYLESGGRKLAMVQVAESQVHHLKIYAITLFADLDRVGFCPRLAEFWLQITN